MTGAQARKVAEGTASKLYGSKPRLPVILLEQGHRNFVLNLAAVPYIDSFGLGQFVTIWTSIRSRDGQLVLLRPTDHVRQLLQITKLDSIFHISVEESQAVSSARRSFVALA